MGNLVDYRHLLRLLVGRPPLQEEEYDTLAAPSPAEQAKPGADKLPDDLAKMLYPKNPTVFKAAATKSLAADEEMPRLSPPELLAMASALHRVLRVIPTATLRMLVMKAAK